ncbi:hypothetical protein F441_01192 [Phytophthora nicotianae CJ01A1]|uniref:Uncharacterized protein n=1 Tax=Phytophthora nicotianae CJ01A1 TaxID=1317063 RepID=W2XSZ9_PHYNI|nr:hypothetical protein F441_01192 [Phytophthora nicotianae CJ01A1]
MFGEEMVGGAGSSAPLRTRLQPGVKARRAAHL